MDEMKEGGRGGLPLPADGPLLSLEDVAAYLRKTPAAVRKIIEGRPDCDDGELGEALRHFVVKLSARRRYIAREPFLAWIKSKIGPSEAVSADPGAGFRRCP